MLEDETSTLCPQTDTKIVNLSVHYVTVKSRFIQTDFAQACNCIKGG